MIQSQRPCCALCDRAMKYGEVAVFTKSQMLCENCAVKTKSSGEAKILGGDKPSIVDRERAAKNLKRFQRSHQKRTAS